MQCHVAAVRCIISLQAGPWLHAVFVAQQLLDEQMGLFLEGYHSPFVKTFDLKLDL